MLFWLGLWIKGLEHSVAHWIENAKALGKLRELRDEVRASYGQKFVDTDKVLLD